MRKRIRQLFWFIVLSGILSIFQGFVKTDFVKSMRDSRIPSQVDYNGVGGENGNSKGVSAWVRNGLNLAQKGLDSVCSDCGLKLSSGSKDELSSVRRQLRVLTPAEPSANINQDKPIYNVEVKKNDYVYRDGKYHRAAANNVYYDSKGNPTLVIDNSQARYAQPENEDGFREAGSSGSGSPALRKRDVNSTQQWSRKTFVEKGVPKGTDAYSPGSLKEMMDTAKQARKNLEERNKILNQLAE